MLVSSVYWMHKDDELNEKINQLGMFGEAEDDSELYLFSAVSAYRLRVDGWQKQWIDFFEKVGESEYIRRGWDYLCYENDEPLRFFIGHEKLMAGKYFLSTGEDRKALENLSSWLESEISRNGSICKDNVIITDIEKLFIRLGETRAGGSYFEELYKTGSSDNSSELLFTAARLYRKSGRYRDADRCLDELLKQQGDKVSDRILWYSFDVIEALDLSVAVRDLGYYIDRWDDAEYFSDVLDELCTDLVRNRKWKDIFTVYKMIDKSGPKEVADRFGYISRRAAQEGYISAQFEEYNYSDLYYRILSSDPLAEIKRYNHADLPEINPEELNEAESYIYNLLQWDLEGVVSEEIKKNNTQLSEAFLIYCAAETAESNRYLDSIRMMYQYQGELSFRGLGSLYPVLYRSIIEDAAEENGLPPQLLFALVWKESGFEKAIVSRSGAVGLSQLMPSTADDIASRMRKGKPDLTDPKENIAIGSWYLKWLSGYVGNNAAAVISYNGGPGRVKSWMRKYSDLPLDLFFEAVPIRETHEYGKKVLTISVLYGKLYYGCEPEEMLDFFFPGISGRK